MALPRPVPQPAPERPTFQLVVTEGRRDLFAGDRRTVEWLGETGWPGIPRAGDVWFHCEGWGGEDLARVYLNGPDAAAAVTVEVTTTADVLDHLLADHPGWLDLDADPTREVDPEADSVS